jgi:hypothetical protein
MRLVLSSHEKVAESFQLKCKNCEFANLNEYHPLSTFCSAFNLSILYPVGYMLVNKIFNWNFVMCVVFEFTRAYSLSAGGTGQKFCLAYYFSHFLGRGGKLTFFCLPMIKPLIFYIIVDTSVTYLFR